jgi:uncharacterized protein YqeY
MSAPTNPDVAFQQRRSAWEQYVAATRPALAQYEAAIGAAWEQYGAAERRAWARYEAAKRAALEQYLAATDPAREQYDAALAALAAEEDVPNATE